MRRSKNKSARPALLGIGLAIAAATGVAFPMRAQPIGLDHLYDLPSACSAETMTMRQDAGGLPFLYVAAKEAGLRVYDVDGTPSLVANVTRSQLAGLDVMSLAQTGDRLFLALGDHFSSAQSPGLAVLDIADPAHPAVLDVWRDPALRGGAGAVASDGRSVYLGAMYNGLVSFAVSPAGKLQKLARLVPSTSYPDHTASPKQYNARGITLRGNLLYLAYDAGGLRVINVKNPGKPVEAGRWSNPVMNGKPRAYNALALDGNRAYVTVDYCGLEVLDVTKPKAIKLLAWWNPWHCETNPFNWFSSPGHLNEIDFDPRCKLVFASAGKSDLQVIGVGDPSHPVLRGGWGGVGNGIGTWGVTRAGDQLYLSYICTLGIPFASNWSGVKALRYDAGACGD